MMLATFDTSPERAAPDNHYHKPAAHSLNNTTLIINHQYPDLPSTIANRNPVHPNGTAVNANANAKGYCVMPAANRAHHPVVSYRESQTTQRTHNLVPTYACMP